MSSKHYNIEIVKVLKQIHRFSQLRDVSVKIINSMIINLAERLISLSIKLSQCRNMQTIKYDVIWTAVYFTIKAGMRSEALQEANKAMTRFKIASNDIKKSREKNAGLQFKMSVTESLFKKYNIKKSSIDEDANVGLTAILEYVAAEILEVSGKVAKQNKKVQITPRHIMIAIKNDDALSRLFNGFIIGTGMTLTKKYNYEIGLYKNLISIIRDKELKILMYRAGIKNISDDILPESKEIFAEFIWNFLTITMEVANICKNDTFTYEDGINALKFTKINVYATKGFPGLISPCKNPSKTQQSARINTEINRHRTTGCTLMPHYIIEDIIKFRFKDSYKCEPEYVWLLHAIVEDYLIDIFQDALMVAKEFSRNDVTAQDISIVRKLRL